jgi:septum formation protein
LNLVLASASERRQELLKKLTENFKIVVSDFDEESIAFNGNCEDYVKELSEAKALAAVCKVGEPSIIIGCDTIVTIDNKVLGKPKDAEDAYYMLKLLSGNVHKVYTGIALVDTESNRVISGFSCTEVKFSEISDEKIRWYISTGDPADKAGAYGIQGYAGVFVEWIKGCYYNVVGLPLNKLYNMLGGMGINL